jgi:hypothetical protein
MSQEGVNADAISREELLNAPGEVYSVKLTTPGDYGYACEPHGGEFVSKFPMSSAGGDGGRERLS